MREIKISLTENINGYITEISEKIPLDNFVQMVDNKNVLNDILYSLERQLNIDILVKPEEDEE